MSTPEIPGFAVAPMALADAAAWAEFALRPEVTHFTSSVARSVDDLVPMIERTLSAEPNAPWLFAVRDPRSGELVVTVGFHTVSALNRSAEVTYTVRPEHWGRGLATAACDGAVRWAFARQGWVRVQATTLESHVASQRVLQKCGFEFEGKLRNFRIVRGEPRDFLLYARVPSGPAHG
jgi:ribosomal-protein-alanine N-acetyltransferase